MKRRPSDPILSFLWRSDDIGRAVTDMAGQTSTGAIFDVSADLTPNRVDALQAAGVTDIKISSDQLIDPAMEAPLRRTGAQTLWIEYHGAMAACKPDAFLSRIAQLSDAFCCIPISSELDFLLGALQPESALPAVALKGSEAAGFVSRETTGVLYAALRAEIKGRRTEAPGLILWGGVATPEAAAAFLCSGAVGVVFESLHWQTDLVSADPALKQRLAALRPEHTAVIGHQLDVPCRLFDKGNSLAVRGLKQYVNAQFGCEVSDEDRRAFARHVRETAVSALASDLGREDLIFLGPEAAFAETFAERFGRSSRRALAAFLDEVVHACGEAPQKLDGFLENRAAMAMGTRLPFLQGAMTWISDLPDFALSVADAGGLPAIALGMKSRLELQRDLGRLKEVMGERPYAVNFIALPENPHLEQQLAWIEQTRPPLAVIAAGEPAYAARLQEKGIQTIYIATNEGLIRMAFKAGVRFVVLEGNEAGGHVGEHSTLTLAQIALELRRREPALFQDRYLVLAGGVFDRETAFRALMLGADAIQMGTVYLATREIVATGALRPLYQRLVIDSRPGTTEVSGESVGLRVRSLKTPTINAICSLEREYATGRHDESSFRQRLEALGANSLLLAARGTRQPGGAVLDEETCMREGQFMSGAISGAVTHVRTLTELHHELAQGPLELTLPQRARRQAPRTALRAGTRPAVERVAITGMAIANSLGHSPQMVWDASCALKSGITEVPRSRWNHDLFYDPDPRAQGKTYCNVGAFMNLDISRKELGIAPQDFRSMADSTRLTLWLAHQAVGQSGLVEAPIPRERISVLVSQNSGESAATITDLVFDVHAHEVIDALRGLIPMTPELEKAVAQKIRSGRLTVDDTTLLGRLNCAAGGFVCNKYGFQGPSHSVSAACASSLVALYNAIQMIRNGIIDAAVVGGGEELVQQSHYLEFSALKALAQLSGQKRPAGEVSRPFDRGRDGMVLGEGGAMIVVERESVAVGRGAPIYAYITGIGASNNDRGMVESLAEPQMIAIRASFQDTGYGPDSVDLVECHATSTVQGDIEEVKALKALMPSPSQTTLTSFKSQIGHTLGASGLNSLIRGVCAMQAGILPPTLNYQTPDPQIGLEAAGFRVPTQPADWPQPTDRPRRLQVNAFGFGGANYVVQLEACRGGAGRVMASMVSAQDAGKSLPSGRESHATVEGVSFFKIELAGRPHRVAVVAPDETESRARLEALLPTETHSPLSEKSLRVMARQGVFAQPADQEIAPLAYVFAGQGSQYVGMGKELYHTFPEIRTWMDKIAAVADFDLLDLLFHSAEEDLQKTRWQQPALYTMEFAMVQQLMALGARPAALAGHSLGELVALAISGVFSYQDGFGIVNKRAQCMDKASGLRGDPGTMVAVDAPMDYLKEKLAACENVYFTNYNSPHQVVLGGDTAPVLALMEKIKQEGFRATQIKVSMAFHSPIMKVIHEEMADFVSGISFHPPTIPVLSNTTMKPYPDDPDQIRRILMAHLESPVHWMQNVTSLWEDFGVRHFVEIGPKDTLCNLVGETLTQALCIPTCLPEAEVPAYRAGVAHLYALGHLAQDGIPLRAPARAGIPSPMPAIGSRSIPVDRVGAIVQREINAFVMDSFGKIIKTQIVEAVRRELDPGFSQERLDRWLGAPAAPPPPAEPMEAVAPIAPPRPSPEPTSAAPPTAPVAPADGQKPIDFVEQTIRIIMEATGYERDEIAPEMDIRQDLAIRSSRLPVIMDDIERHFGITVNVEDFIDKRTVGEIAQCIERLAGQSAAGASAQATNDPPVIAPAVLETAETSSQNLPAGTSIKRLVLEEVSIPPAAAEPLVLAPGQEVAVLRCSSRSAPAAELSQLIEDRFGARILTINCLSPDDNGRFDLRTPAGAQNVAQRLMASHSLAGIVCVLDGGAEPALAGPEDVSAFLAGVFVCIKSLAKSKSKAFCLSVVQNVSPHSLDAMAGEGLLGMFLAATHEYPSLLFRSMVLDRHTEVKRALDLALDIANPVIQLICRGQETFTLNAANAPLPLAAAPALELKAGDVVVMSGGAGGVTYRIARALAPFRVRVVLLGRTELDTAAAYGTLSNLDGPVETTMRRLFKMRKEGPTGAAGDSQTSKNLAGLEIARNVSRLSALGLKASYHRCDVADPHQVAQTLDQVARQYGRIDGIIHGAGLIRDNFMLNMTSEDFQQVVGVKLLGAWNLYREAKNRGLRFFAGLSSIVAIQGNVGQVNYCAANRAMAALLSSLPASHEGLVSKTLMLPPIEGTGMADDPEVKALMERKGLKSAFVHADEFAQVFCRELFLGPPQPYWVLLARTFPAVKGTRVVSAVSAADKAVRCVDGIGYRPGELPMIGSVEAIDLKEGRLTAKRVFSLAVDPWIEDHKPFKFLKHPLISGIMAVETFLEAAHLLFPYLEVLGVRRLAFEDILECASGMEREARITCQRQEGIGQEVLCEVQLASADISPSGRPLERWSTNYRGQVVLGPKRAALGALPDFGINTNELDTRPMEPPEVQASYETRTGLKGRYRVLDRIHGTGPEVIKGEMIYREHEDVAGVGRIDYQYAPYLLEALMHLFAFHAALRQEEGASDLIPAGMGDMRYARLARNGERFTLEARRRAHDNQGVTWDARALDENGHAVMQVVSMRMNRFKG